MFATAEIVGGADKCHILLYLDTVAWNFSESATVLFVF